MKTNKALALALLVSFSGWLSSCTSGNSSLDNSTSSTTATSDNYTIYFWHTSGQTVQSELETRIDEFEKLVLENDGITINIELQYQGSYDDILTKILTSFTTGTQPSLAIAYPDHVAEYLARETNRGDFVVDLSQYINDDEVGFGKEEWIGDGDVSDFVDVFYQEGSNYAVEGVYSLPLMKSTEVMYYNASIVLPLAMEYNTSLTTTSRAATWLASLSWDEFMDFCYWIYYDSSYDHSLVSDFYTCFYDSDSNLFITNCMQNDIPFIGYNDDGSGSILFNNDEAKEMVTELKQAHDDKILTTKDTTGVYGSSYFTAEKCLFDIGSSGGAGYNYPSGGAFEVGICPVPAFNPDNPVYVTQGLTATVLNAADDTDGMKALYSYKFLKYLTSTDVNTQLCINGSEGYVAVRESCYETALFQEFSNSGEMIGDVAKVVVEEIDGSYYNTPVFKGSAYARDAVGGIIAQVFTGLSDIDTAFANAENTAKNNL